MFKEMCINEIMNVNGGGNQRRPTPPPKPLSGGVKTTFGFEGGGNTPSVFPSVSVPAESTIRYSIGVGFGTAYVDFKAY